MARVTAHTTVLFEQGSSEATMRHRAGRLGIGEDSAGRTVFGEVESDGAGQMVFSGPIHQYDSPAVASDSTHVVLAGDLAQNRAITRLVREDFEREVGALPKPPSRLREGDTVLLRDEDTRLGVRDGIITDRDQGRIRVGSSWYDPATDCPEHFAPATTMDERDPFQGMHNDLEQRLEEMVETVDQWNPHNTERASRAAFYRALADRTAEHVGGFAANADNPHFMADRAARNLESVENILSKIGGPNHVRPDADHQARLAAVKSGPSFEPSPDTDQQMQA